MGFTMGLNLLLLVAMVATNILSLYHLSSTLQPKPPTPPPVPDHLLRQLHTIRATINHLQPTTTSTTSQNPTSNIPSELLLYSQISPIASSCKDHPLDLHKYMTYTPFSTCPLDSALAESLILRGCHPLPRRRCFTPTTKPDLNNVKNEKTQFLSSKPDLDLPIQQFLNIAKSANSVIRLGLDIGGGTGSFAAVLKKQNVTVVTTTMNLGMPNNEAVASKGLLPLHTPLQQRLPVFDGVLDVVRCGHAVNRWIPVTAMEFLFYDVDRVLRGGGYFWLDHFFSKGVDLDKVYTPLIGKLGYKKVKWAVGDKKDSSGVKNGEVYLTVLLQKPLSK